MKVYVSRDSVCAGDDVDAPHGKNFTFSSDITIGEIIASIISSYLPNNISGGNATWVASSRVPLAVHAQQWKSPKELPQTAFLSSDLAELDYLNNHLRLHFSYLAQQDPNQVFEILGNIRLRAT